MTIKKLLVANRGEIAVRIIRAARDLGIKTVQVYSQADADSLACEIADEAIAIGEAPASKSYLDGDKVLAAAVESQADAIHPGYGFLAENADFADKVQAAGITYVGPSGETIRLMGDKARARQVAEKAGVAIVPGSALIKDLDEAQKAAQKLGFPVMIKAAAGGGGRGIRIANNPTEFAELAAQAAIEAKAAFGDDGLYFEKVIENARHVEVQILGDGKQVIHLFERECSLQRRRQKIWEEAPAITLSDKTRKAICQAAVDLASAVKYKGAGTIEYLYDEKSEEFYFIEMNTRIQVEHPVTEMITGVDLLTEMLLVAGGRSLGFAQEDIAINGHAIEVRINAEDPAMSFMPSPGQITNLRIPGGAGIRMDHMMYPSYQIPPFYDALLGKLIAWGKTREQAMSRLARAVAEIKIEGVKTTTPLFSALVEDPEVRSGDFHTKWLEQWLETQNDKLQNDKPKNNNLTDKKIGAMI